MTLSARCLGRALRSGYGGGRSRAGPDGLSLRERARMSQGSVSTDSARSVMKMDLAPWGSAGTSG